MIFSKRKKGRRVCVIGLDGVPYSLFDKLAQKEIMPTFSRLLERGYLHRIKASLPEISSVSWSNFMTGTNPGSHGIFGFTDLKKGSYELRFPNFLDLKTETFWDILGKMKKKCIILNQPSTYPARRISGVLVSGFVAIDLAKAVFPMSLKDTLEKINYRIDIDTFKCREDHEFLWQELHETLDSRLRAFDILWKGDWDYFEFVITGTDRLHHFLWNAYENEDHPHHQNFMNYYRRIDEAVGRIVRFFEKPCEEEDVLYILSDHGFTAIEQEVYLNVCLEREGYLKFRSKTPQNLSEIDESSCAFALDPNRIYLHLKGKFPRGCVRESEKEALKKEIAEKMKKIEYKGRKVVREVFDAQEIYSGPFCPDGPDLIVLSEPGFDMKGSVKKKEIFGRTSLQGMHTWDDAFFWSREDHGRGLSISNLASIIMAHYE